MLPRSAGWGRESAECRIAMPLLVPHVWVMHITMQTRLQMGTGSLSHAKLEASNLLFNLFLNGHLL